MARRSLSLVLLLGACAGSSLDELDPAIASSEPTWAADVRPVFMRSCTACHAADGLRAGGVELDTYEAAYSARVKNVCVSVSANLVSDYSSLLTPLGPSATPCSGWEADSMPTGALPPLTTAEQRMLIRWLETGAPP